MLFSNSPLGNVHIITPFAQDIQNSPQKKKGQENTVQTPFTLCSSPLAHQIPPLPFQHIIQCLRRQPLELRRQQHPFVVQAPEPFLDDPRPASLPGVQELA